MLPERTLRARVRIRGAAPREVPVEPGGRADVDPVQLAVEVDGEHVRWSVEATRPVELDAVGLVWDAGPVAAGARMFVHGYQSWAPARTMRLGVDTDPSAEPRALPLVRAAFHADPAPAAPGELRSEQVTVLATAGERLGCVGFAGGESHAGTIRARVVAGRLEVCAEAWLGGALLRAGERRNLHEIVLDAGDDAAELLERWAARTGARAHARVDAPFQVGWCSWYQYFHDVTETAVRDNLAHAQAQSWPFDVFQLDDGFQAAIGDWLYTNERFPSGVEGVAGAISSAGFTPGIWIAPFIAAPASDLARRHPEWLARAPRRDGFAVGMYNEPWGGVMAALDTTNPEVLDHLAGAAAALVDAGYRYLKLDFTFAAAMPGRFADPTRTPAERVRAGFEAIRRGAGDEAFVLGCGAPVGAVVGVVDGMRIGPDVAPWWNPPDGGAALPGYERTVPSTRNAYVNTCTRSFMHRRLWLNDPDCVMLRTTDTALPAAAVEAWARIVGASGGMVLVSDDLSLLGPDARQLLDEVVAAGRAADDRARRGAGPRCIGLLDPADPPGLRLAGSAVVVDAERGSLAAG
jgi:alpha-galactosidase